MKKIVFLLLLFITSIVFYAQDLESYDRWQACETENEKLEKNIERLTAEKDRLEKIVSNKKDEAMRKANTERERKESYETQVRQTQSIQQNISNSIIAIKNKTDSIKDFKQSNAKLIAESEKYASAVNNKESDYNTLKTEHQKFNNKLKKEIALEEKSGLAQGRKKERTNYWSIKYKNKSFDNLVSMTNLEIINYDATIIKNSTEIEDLRVFYKAKECLAQKYDAAKVAQAISDLDVVIEKNPSSKKALDLKLALSNYNTVNEAFNNLVKKMDDYNYKTPGVTPAVKKKKKINYMNMVANFMKSTDYDYTQYEYISKKLVEVMKIKSSVEGVEENIGNILN